MATLCTSAGTILLIVLEYATSGLQRKREEESAVSQKLLDAGNDLWSKIVLQNLFHEANHFNRRAINQRLNWLKGVGVGLECVTQLTMLWIPWYFNNTMCCYLHGNWCLWIDVDIPPRSPREDFSEKYRIHDCKLFLIFRVHIENLSCVHYIPYMIPRLAIVPLSLNLQCQLCKMRMVQECWKNSIGVNFGVEFHPCILAKRVRIKAPTAEIRAFPPKNKGHTNSQQFLLPLLIPTRLFWGFTLFFCLKEVGWCIRSRPGKPLPKTLILKTCAVTRQALHQCLLYLSLVVPRYKSDKPLKLNLVLVYIWCYSAGKCFPH